MNHPENRIQGVFPYLRVKGAQSAIDYYTHLFGARELFRLVEPQGRIGHCELEVGGAILMLSEEYPEHGLPGPQAPGTAGISIHLHVDDVDDMAARAVATGAVLVKPPADQFHGERSCTIRDPFGHEWLLGHEFEVVPPDEMQRRFTELCLGRDQS